MKIFVMSDTHNKHKYLKEFKDTNVFGEDQEPKSGDIIIHAGDATCGGTLPEITAFMTWFGQLNFKHKIFVAGNHDWLFQLEPGIAKQICIDNGVTYLEDRSVEVEGLIIYGSPWQPEFNSWAFNLPRGEKLKAVWDMLPEKIDILVTHSPPKGIMDQIIPLKGEPGPMEGCEDLLTAVLRVKPRYHVFGHIHSSHGEYNGLWTKFRNVAMLDEINQPRYGLTEIEL